MRGTTMEQTGWLLRGAGVVLGLGATLLAGPVGGSDSDALPVGVGTPSEESPGLREEGSPIPDLSALNVRMSAQPIQPPAGMVQRVVPLPDLRGARPLYGEPTRAAILEDDANRRVLILSTDGDAASGGALRAYLLYDFEIERHLPELYACASARRCASDRTPTTGGLACIAMCLVEALRG